ncbi:hypothetical protein C922_00752 [Plasmodium inui San Antonio 1]|uniref:Uncharacterized protein n=1 Tax=Plasmodium inui San Antonio 1 TaxID=1237626 RepID=W7ABL8_9APIC|nr:hypothetical protein C922_00752 [Plasmodium inui San Antonio 1]EUD69060.1 hypothetical protein C922_00752 [Plasmodium inui San Antonio 1]
MSIPICSNYLHNIYIEFNLFNHFLKDLNQRIQSGNNERYTPIYDSCIENAYNIQNKFHAWNSETEHIDEKFMEYFSQNIIINIKTFLRTNLCCIDENLENLKNRNKKLIEKLKVDLENAENQENYIYELERSLTCEKEKNRNAHNLQEKINNLVNQNEKLKKKNEQLEMSSWKQQEENSKIKVELKKFMSLKKKKNIDNGKRSYNRLNKNMSTLFKRINNNMRRSKKNKLLFEKSRSYSASFLHTINSIMLDEDIFGESNPHKGEYGDEAENYSQKNDIQKNRAGQDGIMQSCSHKKGALQSGAQQSGVLQNNTPQNVVTMSDHFGHEPTEDIKKTIKHIRRDHHAYPITHEIPNNMINSKKFFFRGDKRGICRNELNCYNIHENGNFKMTDQGEKIHTNIESVNHKNTKGKCHKWNKFFKNSCMLKRNFTNNDYCNDGENTLSCYTNTVLIDIRKALRSNQTFLINSILRKRMCRVKKRKRGKLRTLLKEKEKCRFKEYTHAGDDQLHSVSNMIMEDYRSTIGNFYECIKKDIEIVIERDGNINVELFSNYFKNMIKEIHDEKNNVKRKKIDKITRKYLRKIDSYRLRERDFFEDEGNVEDRSCKYHNRSLNKYESFDLRKILKNNYEQHEFGSDNEEEEPFSFSFYENRNIRIIDRLKDLKSNISFFKFYDLIDFPSKS